MLPLKTQELLNERMAQLPDYMQEALAEVPWQGELEKIAVKYRLDSEATKQFVTETALVLMGLEDPLRYGSELQARAGIAESLLPKIAAEVEERVFAVLQKYVLENNEQEIEMLHDEIEVLRRSAESDVDVFAEAEQETVAEMNGTATGENTNKGSTVPTHDPYHEVVDPDDLLM